MNINSVADIYSELDSIIQQIAKIRASEKNELCKKIEENSLRIIGEL
jgi:hypothetical protein